MIKENPDFLKVNAEYPRIGANIAVFWGYPELMLYINKLIHDSRDGTRQGFTADVSSALVDLMIEHDRIYPQHSLKSTDIWDKPF